MTYAIEEKLGHVWCTGHEIWHEVWMIGDDEENCCDVVNCGNTAYDYSDFCNAHSCFLIKGELPPTKNDPYLEKLNEIESTHGW